MRSEPRTPLPLRQVLLLLVLTCLPVPATMVLRGLLGGADLLPVLFPGWHRSLVSFVLYAGCSWAALAGVVHVAGWAQLRAHGLRIVGGMRRVASAVGALLVGIAVYWLVETTLATFGLAGMAGMGFRRPSAFESALLVVSAVATAAFCEEVFFRVIWIGVLGTWVSRGAAATAAIVVFSLIHYPYFGLGGVVFVSVWAVLPSVLFVVFRDVTAPLLLHLMNNTFAYLIVPLWLR